MPCEQQCLVLELREILYGRTNSIRGCSTTIGQALRIAFFSTFLVDWNPLVLSPFYSKLLGDSVYFSVAIV